VHPGLPLDEMNMAGESERMLQAGCTAVVAVLKGRDLYVANAGDSRAVLCRGGAAVALSVDHKPASDGERTRITTAGGFVSEVRASLGFRV
jgi:protein phosphatase 1G